MTITRDQAQMLTTLACAARPTGARQWNPDDVMAEIKKLAGRSLGSVICAVTRASMDRGAERPAVISSAGSHWSDTAISEPFVPRAAPVGTRCTVCGETEEGHRMQDHAYRMPQPPPDPEVVAAKVAALKAELAPTSGPTERRTLEDLAEANPELHARVAALREANPGLGAPPTREPDPQPVTAAVENESEETGDV